MIRNDIMRNGVVTPKFVLSAAMLAGAFALFAWQNHRTNEILRTQPEPVTPEYGVVRFVDKLPEGYDVPKLNERHSDAWYATEGVVSAYSEGFDDEIRMRTDFRRSFIALQENGSGSDVELGSNLERCLGEEDPLELLDCVRTVWNSQ